MFDDRYAQRCLSTLSSLATMAKAPCRLLVVSLLLAVIIFFFSYIHIIPVPVWMWENSKHRLLFLIEHAENNSTSPPLEPPSSSMDMGKEGKGGIPFTTTSASRPSSSAIAIPTAIPDQDFLPSLDLDEKIVVMGKLKSETTSWVEKIPE